MTIARISLIASLVIAAGLSAAPVLAQVGQIQTGLNAAAQGNYGTTPATANQLPIMIGTIIGILLETVGILLLGYLIYAGFQWMTAGGDSKKVDAAVQTIRNVVIGLIIIVAANAIAAFVVGKLGEISTGGAGQPTGSTQSTPNDLIEL